MVGTMTTCGWVRVILACAAVGCGDDGNGGMGGGDDGGAGADARGSAADARPQADAGRTEECGQLTAVMRDFTTAHPDFEGAIATVRGLVEVDLGSDGIPVYAPAGATACTAGPDEFNQWYRDVAGVNMRFEIPLPLTETPAGSGNFVFADDAFFPLDSVGFPERNQGHNFHFTTEIRGTFRYRGGEVFTFTGDDDVFVFVNRKLALDLGGVHGPESATIDFDAQAGDLGITLGGVYNLDVFHAERHTSMSNFRIETSIDCLRIP